jgi:RNA polymerase-binding transcription factor DksA
MLLTQGKALPYLGGPKIFDNDFLFPPAAARESQHGLWQQFLFQGQRSYLNYHIEMKSEDLLKFDKLVVKKMKELLSSHYKISVTEDKQKILEVASKFDDANLNELAFALRRIEKGIYGQCVICRHDIPCVILEINLTARLCPSCQLVMHEKSDA